MIINLVAALGEIRTHKKVKSIEFPKLNEMQISFQDTFVDLVIPLNAEMDDCLLVGIFHNYLKQPESLLGSA